MEGSRKFSEDQETETQQLRIFVNAVNSVTGQCIVETLRNDNENDINPHIIVGTLDEEDPTPQCRGIKRIINVPIDFNSSINFQ
jgi:homoaconitase/3-isopropylmalate dehydratase large subunit